MKSQFKNALNARDYHITTLRMICAVLVALLLVTMTGWILSPRNLTIHNPPDLRSGSTKAWWEVPTSTVYAFSFYIFQQLHSWPKNGEIDYPWRIETLSPYLTPSCQEWLKTDAKQRTSELRERVRGIYEIPGRGYREESVTVIDKNNWIVRLDLVADEYYHTEPVKRALVRYPLKVIRWDLDPETNPFGLAIDCYADIPQRLEAAPIIEPEKRGIF